MLVDRYTRQPIAPMIVQSADGRPLSLRRPGMGRPRTEVGEHSAKGPKQRRRSPSRMTSGSRASPPAAALRTAPDRRAAGAFDLEDPELGGDAARRGEAAAPAVGGEHPVAGDDDRHGIAAEREPDRLGGARSADLAGDLAIGSNLAARNPPRRRPDPLRSKRRAFRRSSPMSPRSVRLAGEQAHDTRRWRAADEGGRLGLDGAGKAPGQRRPRPRRPTLREGPSRRHGRRARRWRSGLSPCRRARSRPPKAYS